MLGIGKRLPEVGRMEKAMDTLVMVPEEMFKALTDPETYALKPVVRRRRAAWEENKKFTSPRSGQRSALRKQVDSF